MKKIVYNDFFYVNPKELKEYFKKKNLEILKMLGNFELQKLAKVRENFKKLKELKEKGELVLPQTIILDTLIYNVNEAASCIGYDSDFKKRKFKFKFLISNSEELSKELDVLYFKNLETLLNMSLVITEKEFIKNKKIIEKASKVIYFGEIINGVKLPFGKKYLIDCSLRANLLMKDFMKLSKKKIIEETLKVLNKDYSKTNIFRITEKEYNKLSYMESLNGMSGKQISYAESIRKDMLYRFKEYIYENKENRVKEFMKIIEILKKINDVCLIFDIFEARNGNEENEEKVIYETEKLIEQVITPVLINDKDRTIFLKAEGMFITTRFIVHALNEEIFRHGKKANEIIKKYGFRYYFKEYPNSEIDKANNDVSCIILELLNLGYSVSTNLTKAYKLASKEYTIKKQEILLKFPVKNK